MLSKKVLIFIFFCLWVVVSFVGINFHQKNNNSIFAQNFPCGTTATPPPIITNPSSGETKNGTINFTICDTNPMAVSVEYFLSVPPSLPFCRNIFNTTLSKPAYPPKEFTSPSWNSTQVSDGTYWLNVKTTYPGPITYYSNVQFSISNGFTGQPCQTPDRPTVNIQANDSDGPITISYNTSAFIEWNSTNSTSCTVSPSGWEGKNGGQSTGNLTASQTYTVNCFGPGGTNNDSVTVNVSAPPSSDDSSDSSSSSSSSSSGSNPSSSSNSSTSNSSTKTSVQPTSTPTVVTPEILASNDKLVIEENIPVSISEFDPDIFLKGSNIKLTSIKNIKKDKTNLIHFEGKTKPNTLVTLYIFSNPIIVTLKSDKNGNWSYERDKRIETGKHSAFATIYDEGVTRRSDVTSFFVAKNSLGNLVLKKNTFDSLYLYSFILGGVVILGIVILIMYRIYAARKTQKT